MARTAVRLHRWLGLMVALGILVSAVSGVALAWRDQVWRAQHPQLDAAAPDLDASGLAAAVDRLLAKHPNERIRLLAPPRDGLAGWQVWFAGTERALYDSDAIRLLDRWDEARSPFGILHDLHVDLLAGAAGRWVMGAIGVGATLLVLLGVLAWLRTPRRPRLRELTPRRLRRGVWLVAHRQWGLLLVVPTMLLMLTGTLMAWSSLWRSGLPAPEAFPASSASTDPGLTAAFHAIRQSWPDAQLRFIDVSELASGRLSARLRQPQEAHPNGRSSVTVALSGALLERYDPAQAGSLGTVDDLVYPLHSGRLEIPGWHLGVVLCGVLLAALCLSGVATWLAGYRTTARRRTTAPAASTH